MNTIESIEQQVFDVFQKLKIEKPDQIKGDFPILWFGNIEAKKPVILTVDCCVPESEYTTQRFYPYAPLELREGYNEYFQNCPNQIYFGWEGCHALWEGLVNRFGASYYDSAEYEYQAIHINICPLNDTNGMDVEEVRKVLLSFLENILLFINPQLTLASEKAFDLLSTFESCRFNEKKIIRSIKTVGLDKHYELDGSRYSRGIDIRSGVIGTDWIIYRLPCEILPSKNTITTINEILDLFSLGIPMDKKGLLALFEHFDVEAVIGKPIFLPKLKVYIGCMPPADRDCTLVSSHGCCKDDDEERCDFIYEPGRDAVSLIEVLRKRAKMFDVAIGPKSYGAAERRARRKGPRIYNEEENKRNLKNEGV